MAWWRKVKRPKQRVDKDERRLRMPEGLWAKCDQCRQIIYREEVERNAFVCPKCGYHFRIDARQRLAFILDDAYEEFDSGIAARDPLEFKDTKPYSERLQTYRDKTGLRDAAVNVSGSIDGLPVIVCVFSYAFMGGSMGSAVGEKVTRAAERALDTGRPLIVVSASGGARMQEGALSLMQMAKISASLAKLHDAGLPFISVLTDPTTGGVTASHAMLGDLILAEPGALIGFAGPRVIEQTIRQKLPEGFQRSEFLLEHGMVDLIVERTQMRQILGQCLRLLTAEASWGANGASGENDSDARIG